MKAAKHFRDLDVYQNAMTQVMRVFESSKKFPTDEEFTLTDQSRRSSRSVCANVTEAWRKRRYQAAFVAKLNDAEAEAANPVTDDPVLMRLHADTPIRRHADTLFHAGA